jgi:hypothetical protein
MFFTIIGNYISNYLYYYTQAYLSVHKKCSFDIRLFDCLFIDYWKHNRMISKLITGIKTCIIQYNNLKMKILKLLLIYTVIKDIYLIYKDECLFVGLSVPYTNPHFWTDRNQTSHTSPPWSGKDRRTCMGPQYFTFPTFSTYFVGSGCRFVRSRWQLAPHCLAIALYPWWGAYWCDVTHGGLCNENEEKWSECVCVKIKTWWDGKEMTNKLH